MYCAFQVRLNIARRVARGQQRLRGLCLIRVAATIEMGLAKRMGFGHNGPRSKFAIAFLLTLLFTLLSAASRFPLTALADGSPQHHSAAKAKADPAPAPREQPMPFRSGETLNYRVSWAAFSEAAKLQLVVPEQRDLYGWHTWHFRGESHTLSTVRSLFPIDDQMDSYTDVFSLESRQFETHLNEFGKEKNEVDHLTASGQISRAPAPIVIVLPGTRDPLGALYTLRSVDWQHTPDFRAPVFDGHNLLEMRASRDSAAEPVKVPAGAYSASRILIHVFQNQKELTDLRLTMWIASDSARTPVAMQADLPFGMIRAELTSASQ